MMPAIRLAALFPLLLSGCIVGAAILPQVMQSSFSAKRAALKRMWQDGQVTKDSAQAACLPLLRAAEPGKAAPPPYPPEVCDFDSFVSQKFELTIALERGLITPAAFTSQCEAFPGPRPAGQDCTFAPVRDKVAAWKVATANGWANPGAAQMDCEALFKDLPSMPLALKPDVCQF